MCTVFFSRWVHMLGHTLLVKFSTLYDNVMTNGTFNLLIFMSKKEEIKFRGCVQTFDWWAIDLWLILSYTSNCLRIMTAWIGACRPL